LQHEPAGAIAYSLCFVAEQSRPADVVLDETDGTGGETERGIHFVINADTPAVLGSPQ